MLTTVRQQLIKENEELPAELQVKMLKLLHFMKEEFIAPTYRINMIITVIFYVSKIIKKESYLC